jgi:glycosyltransferase involved in cell wall biosynthesis
VVNIAAVVTTYQEVDIIAASVLHLYRQGVERIYAADASTDGTYELLKALNVDVERDTETCHRQPYWTGRLAERAMSEGADWIVPFDADEFWFSADGARLANTLEAVPRNVTKLYGPMWHYQDFEWRQPEPKPWPKVIVRAQPGVTFANGNHNATLHGDTMTGAVEIREVQYRGFRHFARKIKERTATLDPTLPAGEGTHQTQYAGWSEIELEPVWKELARKASVRDPLWLR